MTQRPLRVLVVMQGTAHAPYFERVLESMVDRGHAVHLAIETTDEEVWESLERSYRLRYPGLSVGLAPDRERDRWSAVAAFLRHGIDYLFYLDPHYRAPRIRKRARDHAPPSLLRLTDLPLFRYPLAVAALRALFARAERGIPPGRAITEMVREHRPDRLVATLPLRFGSVRADYLRAARSLGAATVYCCVSWKNLTAKGMLRGEPDLLTTWNEPQSKEAVELHGLPPERVVAAGAPSFDHWLGWEPSSSRTDFCREADIDPERPYILYLCSGVFNKSLYGEEAPLIAEWVQHLRTSDSPRLREMGVLVRPHPYRGARPEVSDIAEDGVAVWPSPNDESPDLYGRSSLFDSVHHSAAVVGLNTTAFIDSAIIGRPCFRVVLPGVGPDETDHFRYLVEVAGGILRVAETVEEHLTQLAEVLDGDVLPPNREFVESFVRPKGADRPAAPEVVNAIEGAARAEPPSLTARVAALAARAALLPIAEGTLWLGSGSSARRARKSLRRRVQKTGRRVGKKALRTATLSGGVLAGRAMGPMRAGRGERVRLPRPPRNP